jgi:hypothetical protein
MADISSELRIVAVRVFDIDTGEKGVKRDLGHNAVPVVATPFERE